MQTIPLTNVLELIDRKYKELEKANTQYHLGAKNALLELAENLQKLTHEINGTTNQINWVSEKKTNGQIYTDGAALVTYVDGVCYTLTDNI